MADDKSGRSTQRVSRRKFIGAAGAVGAVAIAGCTEETSDEDKEIDIAGSSTVYPLMEAISEKYNEDEDDSVGFNISSTGSGGGFEDHFCPGETDFNNASRAMKGRGEVEVQRERRRVDRTGRRDGRADGRHQQRERLGDRDDH